jgi:hypothetical protein
LTTPGGAKLIGYVTGACVGAFHEGQLYQFNQALLERSLASAQKLAVALDESAVFPLRIEIVATGRVSDFNLE